MCLRLLREELWSMGGTNHLYRTAVCAVPDNVLEGIAVIVWSRLFISGGDNRRLHEELTLSGGELKHNGFARITQVGKLEALMNNAVPIEPNQTLFEILKTRFTNSTNQIEAAYLARSRERMQYLSNTLMRKKDKEIEDISSILTELENSIHKELHLNENDIQQYLPGFSPEEFAQKRRDFHALSERLKRIPGEREEEKTIIEKHYANPVDRTFPVAVIFLVPQLQTGGRA
jgi:hypothetical protein